MLRLTSTITGIYYVGSVNYFHLFHPQISF
nr:MAG TPA: hypothetical protein [Bacteriophage sp.]